MKNKATAFVDKETGEFLFEDEVLPVRKRECKYIQPIEIRNRKDLLKYKTNYTLHIDYEAISLCKIPQLSKDVFTLICKSIKRENLSDARVVDIANTLNKKEPNISRANSNIPPTMLQKEGLLWRVSPFYACKCPPSYLDEYRKKWIVYLTKNNFFKE